MELLIGHSCLNTLPEDSTLSRFYSINIYCTFFQISEMASEAMHSGEPSDPGPGGSAGSAGTPHSPPAISYSPSKREPIAVRSARINHCVLGVNSSLRSQQSLMPTNTPSSVTPEGPDNATQAKNLINR